MSNQNNNDRRELLFRNVRENARIQSTPEHRENYLRSCENHGGEIAEVAQIVRREFEN